MSSDLVSVRKQKAVSRFDPLPKKAGRDQAFFHAGSDERLIRDVRAALRPAQMVENKISGMLRGAFVMVSHLRQVDLIRHGSGS